MSSSFFEIFDKGYVFEAVPPPEIRLYYNEDGSIIKTAYVEKEYIEEQPYIVITQKQYDSLNKKLHFVIDEELVYVEKKIKHWYLEQDQLARNPYICKQPQTSKAE